MRLMSMTKYVVLCAISSGASAATLLVPADYTSIQNGIDAAVDGDTVLVSPSFYYEVIDFHGKAITVVSVDGPSTTTIDGAIINGPVVTFATGETNLAVLDGFQLRNGNSINGGGIYVQGASPTVRNCIVSGNAATNNGGGIFVDTGIVTLENVSIDNNISAGAGGGIYLKFSQGSMTGGSVISNTGLNGGGMYFKDGTGVFALSSVTFQGNAASSNGGGVYSKNGLLTAELCTFDLNTASRGGAWFSWSGGDATLTDCIFTANTASDAGGAANIRSSISTFVRGTFNGNVADGDCNGAGSGGAIDIVNSSVTLVDPVLCANMVCDTLNDFSGDSPLISGTIQTCAPIGACCGGSSCWEMLEVECISGGGIWNGADTVCAVVSCVGGGVDIGGCCVNVFCVMTTDIACLDASGVFQGVGIACATVQCPSVGCPSDVNQDGVVSVNDLLEVIQAWGACP